jgi:hypothetical protein
MFLADTFVATMWGGLAAAIVVFLGAIHLLLSHLKDRHAALWRGMGSPELFVTNSLAGNWQTLSFIFSDVHRSVDDAYVTRLVGLLRTLFLIGCAIMVALAATAGSGELGWDAALFQRSIVD